MSCAVSFRRVLASIVVIAAGIGAVSPALSDSESAARALAEKFSAAADEADRKAAAAAEEAARRRAEEADMLARARAEQEARAAAAAAEEEAGAAKRAAEAARQAAEAARQQEHERRQRQATEAARVEPVPAASPAASAAPVPSGESLAIQRTREADELTEKLRRAREQRSALGGEPAEPQRARGAGSVVEPAVAPHVGGQRVTVLLYMQPGAKGIRRWNKTADAVLCVAESCYVSRGPAAAAEKMPRWQAFGPLTTLFTRAGACSNALACVFRDVDLEAARALIEPVDLRFIVHDRREAREAGADRTCRIGRSGRLTCERTLAGSGWTAWIVPEHVAAKAGADALADALAANLAAHPGELAGR